MIEIRLFKFDYKTDYLPYYKTYKIKNSKNETVDGILAKIAEIEKFSYLKDEEFFLRVNGIFTSSEANLSEFTHSNSKELLIEPISISRAKNDLMIDIDDYRRKLYSLSAFIDDDKLIEFVAQKKYMLEYYASNTLFLNRDYIGDHVLLLASELIQKNPEDKNAIFEAISHKNDGLQNHTSLEFRMNNVDEFEKKIHQLQRDYHQKISKVYMYKQYKQYAVNFTIEQYFENFNIALYCSLNDASFEDTIKQSKANYVELTSKHNELPLNATNETLLYQIAGHILLEAVDNNADFLIVNSEDELAIFDAQQKKIDKVTGREINLPVLTKEEFLKILHGEKEKKELGLDTHKINISFLD